MSKEAAFRKKIFSAIEELIKDSGTKGIDIRDIVFHLERQYGASEKMIKKYTDKLLERNFVILKKELLVWNSEKKN